MTEFIAPQAPKHALTAPELRAALARLIQSIPDTVLVAAHYGVMGETPGAPVEWSAVVALHAAAEHMDFAQTHWEKGEDPSLAPTPETLGAAFADALNSAEY